MTVFLRSLFVFAAFSVSFPGFVVAASSVSMPVDSFQPFFSHHCYDCHDGEVQRGGLNLEEVVLDLSDAAAMATWVRIHDRVKDGEMPPKKKERLKAVARSTFLSQLSRELTVAHQAEKGTVYRRLNRTEYQNTLNDLFGTHLEFKGDLPEDGRAHGFDIVGEALNVSMAQMQGYLDVADRVVEASIAQYPDRPESTVITASYAKSRESGRFIGKSWKKLDSGAVVFFKRVSYPTGMLREANTRKPGYYYVRVTGFAHQSDVPVTFSIGATTFQRGLEKPTFGFYSFPPGKPSTVEIKVWIENNYMIQIEPWGITDSDNQLKNLGVNKYPGPGLAILNVEVEGPLVEAYPLAGHGLVYDGIERTLMEPRNPRDKTRSWYIPKWDVSTSDPVADAGKVFRRIASKAWRRPAGQDVMAPYVGLFQTELEKGGGFDTALKTGITAILASPDFLYFKETPGELDDFALATRLSYFLSRTLPDDELIQLASVGKLAGDPETLLAQVDRLLDGAKSDRFIEDFTDGWLDLRSIEFTSPDVKLFPEFDPYLQWSMLEETRSFFREILKQDLSVANFIDSDFAILNNRLAEHYGVRNVDGTEFRKVKLPAESPRGGIMAHGSVLKVSSNGTATSPVIRGVWVLERILGITPPPPPPAVPGLEPDIRGAETIRQLLDKHRGMTSCQGCHKLIDPPGFALEQFNPIGGFRENFRSVGDGEKVILQINGRKVRYKIGLAVDPSGQFSDGRSFKDFNEFKKLLMESKADVAHCLTEKLMIFATGRELGFSDRPEIERIVKQVAKEGDGLKSLVKLIVLSEIFQTK
ncbi:DUF1592 domain-containing protein [Verrucomicrobia bacterium]|nr:DUF1592 domain-containing protein [Verrucomicrobiota bacterium]